MNQNRDKLSIQKHVCIIQLQNILTVPKQFLFFETLFFRGLCKILLAIL